MYLAPKEIYRLLELMSDFSKVTVYKVNYF